MVGLKQRSAPIFMRGLPFSIEKQFFIGPSESRPILPLLALTNIEEVAKGFPGVEQVFAFQAGRDVRVLVNPDEVDDDKLTVLAHDIARKLEKEAEYAGQIKVSVIREVRATETTSAK